MEGMLRVRRVGGCQVEVPAVAPVPMFAHATRCLAYFCHPAPVDECSDCQVQELSGRWDVLDYLNGQTEHATPEVAHLAEEIRSGVTRYCAYSEQFLTCAEWSTDGLVASPPEPLVGVASREALRRALEVVPLPLDLPADAGAPELLVAFERALSVLTETHLDLRRQVEAKNVAAHEGMGVSPAPADTGATASRGGGTAVATPPHGSGGALLPSNAALAAAYDPDAPVLANAQAHILEMELMISELMAEDGGSAGSQSGGREGIISSVIANENCALREEVALLEHELAEARDKLARKHPGTEELREPKPKQKSTSPRSRAKHKGK